jgi:hypothetical protein
MALSAPFNPVQPPLVERNQGFRTLDPLPPPVPLA